ncbi:TolC family protein [Candidatus Aerophobetes bacterium]|nr:TolC family protein [Candidatus Aerophobetes bacterium]
MRKKVLATLLTLMAVVLSLAVWGGTEESIPKGDLLQQIIDLVVENNLTLQSQRSLVEQIQALPNPGGGLDFKLSLRGGIATYADEDDQEVWMGPTGSVGLEIPLFSSSRRKDRIAARLTYAKELEKAKQDYLRAKESVVSDLLAKVKKLYQLENEKRKLEELKSFLSSNMESLNRQVKAGVIKSSDLWELAERIMDTENRIYNQSSELEILRREIAINLGGERSEELRQMLEELTVRHIKGRKY